MVQYDLAISLYMYVWHFRLKVYCSNVDETLMIHVMIIHIIGKFRCCLFCIHSSLLGEFAAPPPTWQCSQRGLSGLTAPPAAGVRILTGLTQSTHELQIQGHAHNPNQSDLTELWLDLPGQWPALSSVCSMRCDAWGCSSHFANSEEVSLRIADRSDGQVI